jgi:hypothetical protein
VVSHPDHSDDRTTQLTFPRRSVELEPEIAYT